MNIMQVHLKQKTNHLNKQESIKLCKALGSTRCKIKENNTATFYNPPKP